MTTEQKSTLPDLEALKRAAEAATPGPWVVWSSLYEHMGAQLRSADGTVEGVALAEFYRSANGFKNAEFARLANPATILDLISRLEEAEKALEPFARRAAAMRDAVPLAVNVWAQMPLFKPGETHSAGTVGDFRRAHAAHKRLKGGTDEG